MTETILQEAERLINGERQQQYGEATESFERIAGMWSAYIGKELNGFDVINLMVLLKVSRAKVGYHRDSYVDIAGYAGLGERLYNEQPWIDAETWEEVKEPRTWDYPFQVPPGEGIVVSDANGTLFKPDGHGTMYHLYPVEGDYVEPEGPFVEVLA
ncbi:phosphofructokinase [Mycobacterium phage Tiger]|uniref:DUF6378 domain-containing protein n=3 Tax=Benedictvirus TaxID=2946819 RepID=H9NCW2_9CAUD|nr:phosphofructokinase [Mycobacterium phage Conspiracy]YP_008859074.1 phosphofructokinase [Mycobacterium phage Jovo]YP_009607691.1 phosphofructokinase [Mycobacterium phage Tiger]YP_010061011.1 phosphofructokinase [Mycobacterium phage Archetta]ATW60021.1 hypothetical protein SEA_PHLORENCE_47 [Mycobacterium phage Phlorence]ATW60441.1 hypothetical protein SEA_FORGETIT_49 [Mycobacterium phage ForGetIt]ATW60994.1 hypothetical protein SEA_ARAGOG_48 [Mycobacterium phage Aragog]ATW61236.1 hypothetic